MADKAETPESAARTPAPPPPGEQDSLSFLRCAGCRHAKSVDNSAGTLLCERHNMHVNAEQDEIPDDCVEHDPTAGA